MEEGQYLLQRWGYLDIASNSTRLTVPSTARASHHNISVRNVLLLFRQVRHFQFLGI